MMNFSDETVEKVQASIDTNRKFEGTALHVPDARAALSSLTLADLMPLGAVRELVEEAIKIQEYMDDSDLAKALAPFTEAK